MAKKQNIDELFGDDSISAKEIHNQSFAEMFESSQTRTEKKMNVGDKMTAEILSIGKEESFIEVGMPIDAVISNADLINEKKEMLFKKGDKIDIVVIRVTDDEIRVTKQGSKSAPLDLDSLEDAFDMELPVEGLVTEVVKGGFRVNIQKLASFCPISQMEIGPVEDQEPYVGRKFEFLITKFEPQQKNIVVSRRRLLEFARAEFEGHWLEQNKVGDILVGQVVRLEKYGAFIEVEGGLQGLVHISQIGFSRLDHAKEALQLGDSVQVKIIKIEEEESRLKIALSIKEAGGVTDPWIEVVQDYPVGRIFEGQVEKVAPYGVFVQITPGINGLLPKSKWRDAEDSKTYDNLKRGDKVKLKIDEIKHSERKVSLGLPVSGEDDSWREHQASGTGELKLTGAFAAAFAKAEKKKRKN